MAKRRRRRSGRRRLILLAALVLLVAGFVTRRVLAPRAMHFLTHRSAPAADHSAAIRHDSVRPAPVERLSNSDRRTLDKVIRDKSR